MPIEDGGRETRERLEIGFRFRRLIEQRIERLEKDADGDEARLADIRHADHLRRHTLLIEVQRAEAQRMRRFVDNSGTRVPPPEISA